MSKTFAFTEMGQRVTEEEIHPFQMIRKNEKRFRRIKRIRDGKVLQWMSPIGWIESQENPSDNFEERPLGNTSALPSDDEEFLG